MIDLENFMTKLRKVDFDAEDLASADEQGLDIEDIADEVERIIDIITGYKDQEMWYQCHLENNRTILRTNPSWNWREEEEEEIKIYK